MEIWDEDGEGEVEEGGGLSGRIGAMVDTLGRGNGIDDAATSALFCHLLGVPSGMGRRSVIERRCFDSA